MNKHSCEKSSFTNRSKSESGFHFYNRKKVTRTGIAKSQCLPRMLDKSQATLTNGFRAFRGADLIINARVRFLSRLLLHACVFCQDYYCTRAFFVKAIIARVRFFASVYNNQQRNISKVLAEIRRHHPNSKWSKPVI